MRELVEFLVRALVEQPDRVEVEEFEEDGWSADEVKGFVTALADLAGVARAQGRALFVWMMQDEGSIS